MCVQDVIPRAEAARAGSSYRHAVALICGTASLWGIHQGETFILWFIGLCTYMHIIYIYKAAQLMLTWSIWTAGIEATFIPAGWGMILQQFQINMFHSCQNVKPKQIFFFLPVMLESKNKPTRKGNDWHFCPNPTLGVFHDSSRESRKTFVCMQLHKRLSTGFDTLNLFIELSHKWISECCFL